MSIDIEDTAIVIIPANTFDTKVKHAKKDIAIWTEAKAPKKVTKGSYLFLRRGHFPIRT